MLAVTLSGCGGDKGDGTPTLEGKDPTLVAQADCGTDGVANVRVKYDQIDDTFLIGRNELTKSLGGGTDTFDRRYGIDDNSKNLRFTITTDPTRGTCKTTLTDGEKGDVLAEKSSAGKVELSVIVRGE